MKGKACEKKKPFTLVLGFAALVIAIVEPKISNPTIKPRSFLHIVEPLLMIVFRYNVTY